MTQSIFPSMTVRAKMGPGRRYEEEEEWEMEDEEEGMENGFSHQRSVTSPPLLESYNRHQTSPSPVEAGNKPSPYPQDPREERETSSKRQEVQVTAEIHEPYESATSKPGQVLSIEPTTSRISGGRRSRSKEEVVIEGKSFALKYIQ